MALRRTMRRYRVLLAVLPEWHNNNNNSSSSSSSIINSRNNNRNSRSSSSSNIVVIPQLEVAAMSVLHRRRRHHRHHHLVLWVAIAVALGGVVAVAGEVAVWVMDADEAMPLIDYCS